MDVVIGWVLVIAGGSFLIALLVARFIRVGQGPREDRGLRFDDDDDVIWVRNDEPDDGEG